MADAVCLRDGLEVSFSPVGVADHHRLLARAPGRGLVGHAIYVRAPRAQHAADRHITRFFAEVLPENRDMLAVFRDAFATVSVTGPDAIELEFPTSGWRAASAHLRSARPR